MALGIRRVITGHDDPEDLARQICVAFDELVPAFYDDDARRRGWTEVEDRRGEVSRVALMSVDVGIAPAVPGEFAHVGELVARATEMKHVAKLRNDGGSTWAVDRRTPDPEPDELYAHAVRALISTHPDPDEAPVSPERPRRLLPPAAAGRGP